MTVPENIKISLVHSKTVMKLVHRALKYPCIFILMINSLIRYIVRIYSENRGTELLFGNVQSYLA